jgi:hypothetical protein
MLVHYFRKNIKEEIEFVELISLKSTIRRLRAIGMK